MTRELAREQKSRTGLGRLSGGEQRGRSEGLVVSHNGDDAVHRSSVVAIWVLNAAVRTGGFGLVVSVQHGVEAAVEREYARMPEGQPKRATVRFQKDIRSPMAGSVECVIAYHSVVIEIVVDPNHGLSDSDGEGERNKPIFVGHDDLPCWGAAIRVRFLTKGK
jgi:hypothetical protein